MENESRPNGSKKEMITYILIVILLTFSFNLISGHVSHYSLTAHRGSSCHPVFNIAPSVLDAVCWSVHGGTLCHS
jgi:hypothetical protein